MKRIFLGILFCSAFLFGCGKVGKKDALQTLSKKISENKGYHLEATLEIANNEDTYSYDVDVAYSKTDFFRVSLKNKTNNHEQIILRNTEGVYVLNPNLNKSFKFQSEWPYNNSQIYLLQTIVSDIEKDKEYTLKETKDGYLFTSTVNYSSNSNLTKQNVYFDSDLNLKEVNILNDENQIEMSLKVSHLDMKATYDEKYFTLKENMTTSNTEETIDSVSSIEDIIYPMYIPENTKLESQDKVSLSSGERIIETFSGDKPFTFIQETISVEEEYTTTPMYGEPLFVNDVIGSFTDHSVSWISNGIEYYVTSEDLSSEELLNVARSVSVIPVGK